MREILERLKSSARSAAAELLRAIRPKITPALILRALLGVLLFFVGIIFGCWLIIRHRRRYPADD
jgi:hypothetical protein